MIHHHVPRKRRWRRLVSWCFAAAVVVCLAYLGERIVNVVLQARTALGLTRIEGPGIDNLLAIQGNYTPPADGLLRPAQVHVAVRVAELADTLELINARPGQRRSRLAGLLNQHGVGKAQYLWARTTLLTAITHPRTHADSVNANLVHIMQPRMDNLRRILQQSLDQELLGKGA
jgi:hypothetical protein